MTITTDSAGVIRLPALVRGTLTLPPALPRPEIETAFARADGERTGSGPASLVKFPEAWVLREPILERDSMRASGEYQYQVMPAPNPLQLIEDDLDALAGELYELTFAEVLNYLDGLQQAYAGDAAMLDQVKALMRQTSEAPDPYVDAGLAVFPIMLGREVAESMVDTDLAAWQVPGRRFLDGWVEVPGTQYPAPVHLIHAQHLPPIAEYDPTRATPRIRALPTRQLHITAGNSPLVPLASLLRAIWTKSAATIKLPYGATLAGAYLAQLAANTFPDHPLTRHLSVLYWPGGDRQFEAPLFLPGRYDRIVVWGAPNAVLSVTERAAFTKTVTFNPRYGVSLIGREAFDHLEQVVSRAVCDTLIQGQKACIASQIHYLEADQAQAERYAAALRDELGRWDGFAPAALSRSQQGQLRRMKRGSFMGATWFENQSDGQYRSAVAVMPDEFNIMEHPLCRLIVVRPVPSLERALQYLHPGVATAGVFPESRRHALSVRIGARGVSNVPPLGQAGYTYPGMPHDGMLVLSELVDWKTG